MTETPLPLREIDWSRDAVWIQREDTLFLVSHDPPSGLVLRNQKGETLVRPASELVLTHDATEAGRVYKAKADPMQAFRPRSDCRLTWDGHTGPALVVTNGAVAVRRADGTVFVLSAERYQQDFQIVAQAGARPPPR